MRLIIESLELSLFIVLLNHFYTSAIHIDFIEFHSLCVVFKGVDILKSLFNILCTSKHVIKI